ncbi:MAG: bacterial transcriptional activator domain-containing protein [Gammaproteobacteria bacterium]|jgi:two-component SAPR family response regulator
MALTQYKASPTHNLQTDRINQINACYFNPTAQAGNNLAGLHSIRPSSDSDHDFSDRQTLLEDALKHYPIVITALGHFNVYKNGRLLTSNNQQNQHKPSELLKLVIALGSRCVGEVRINDALWPDADGDVAHTSFSVTLHRIRKLLNMEALQLSDSHLTLNPEVCWVDVWALQKTLGKIKDAINSINADTDTVQSYANMALQLYQGHFLGNEDEQPWSVAYGEKIKSKFMRCLIQVCDYFERQELCHLAIDYYRKGIEVEPLSEEFYLRLMKCYIKRERRVEAIAIYQQCARIFNALTGCSPSADTTAVYRQLTNAAA